jgi:hypothetical protein
MQQVTSIANHVEILWQKKRAEKQGSWEKSLILLIKFL